VGGLDLAQVEEQIGIGGVLAIDLQQRAEARAVVEREGPGRAVPGEAGLERDGQLCDEREGPGIAPVAGREGAQDDGGDEGREAEGHGGSHGRPKGKRVPSWRSKRRPLRPNVEPQALASSIQR
jgi:hypothetical protein